MRLTLLFLFSLFSSVLLAAPLESNDLARGPVGHYAMVMQETDKRLTLGEARLSYAEGRFRPAGQRFLTFGIGAKPVWLRFEVHNNGTQRLMRRLSIETSWLDNIEVYLMSGDVVQRTYLLGDTLPYAERPLDDRFFSLEHAFLPGVSSIYLRVQSTDPLVLPVYLGSTEAMHERRILDGYSYGIIYGVISALLLYNLVLYFSLKFRRHLAYSVYLLFFILMNMSYTGHAYRWLWPQATTWQLWSNPVLMIAYAISGLLFATSFLESRNHLPRLQRLTLLICVFAAVATAVSVYNGWHQAALLIAFCFIVIYTGLMLTLGAVSRMVGVRFASYFLIACAIAAIGATVTGLTVWGVIPYSVVGYRAVEIGMVLEAILLALALANLFRQNQDERYRAEQMARIDPLTGLNNRRSFSELVEPQWLTGQRNQHEMAVIILDLDHFKDINDNYGHNRGDQVLVEVARTLKESARAGDVLARWGGEEFILFLPETTLNDAVEVAERMRNKIAALKIGAGGRLLSPSASFGVANWVDHRDTLEAVIIRADRHLYRAKEQGRNRVCSPKPRLVDTADVQEQL